jgi:DNA repair protein RadC
MGDVFRAAMMMNAAAIIAAHNHASGDFEPSLADFKVTTAKHQAGKLIGLDVLDHLIF